MMEVLEVVEVCINSDERLIITILFKWYHFLVFGHGTNHPAAIKNPELEVDMASHQPISPAPLFSKSHALRTTFGRKNGRRTAPTGTAYPRTPKYSPSSTSTSAREHGSSTNSVRVLDFEERSGRQLPKDVRVLDFKHQAQAPDSPV
jgi:hypothetical protein